MAEAQAAVEVVHAISWFDIPTVNIDRAAKFYSEILAQKVERDDSMGMPMAFLPTRGGGVGGALMHDENYTPSQAGVLIYLNGGDDLSDILVRVEAAGGQVLQPKTSIGEHGNIAVFMDSEGNRIGLHSDN